MEELRQINVSKWILYALLIAFVGITVMMIFKAVNDRSKRPERLQLRELISVSLYFASVLSLITMMLTATYLILPLESRIINGFYFLYLLRLFLLSSTLHMVLLLLGAFHRKGYQVYKNNKGVYTGICLAWILSIILATLLPFLFILFAEVIACTLLLLTWCFGIGPILTLKGSTIY